MVLYQACSQPNPLHSDDVALVRAEDRKLVFREQNGYMDYRPEWFNTDEQENRRVDELFAKYEYLRAGSRRSYVNNIYKGEVPWFVTAVCFPGN